MHSLHRGGGVPTSGRRCLAGHNLAPTVSVSSNGVLFHVSSEPASRTLVTVRMGRHDGNSGGRKRRWYPTGGPGPSSGGGGGTTTAGTLEDSRSRDRYRDEGRRQGGPRWDRPQDRDRDPEDGADDERGWWEKPEEASLEAYAPKPLEPWQVERLEQAYCTGRRKVQMQQLSAELSLDRAVVVDWFKRFALRPEEEQRAILTERRAELAKKKVEEEAFLKEEEERRRQSHNAASASGQAARHSPTDRTPAPAASDDWLSAEPQPQGFVPFYQRKEAGLVGRKRLPADALRSLEAVYYRTPFPSKEMIQGLFDLHRLTRDTVLDWFVERRKADGITSSTQRRVGKRDLDKDLAWDQDDDGEGSLDSDDGHRGGSGRRGGRDPEPSSKDADMLRALGGAATRGPAPGEPQTMQVFSMSKREMAQLRSAMPSPRKRTGQQMAEKMQIKTGADQTQTQIYDLQFVEDTTKHEDKWARSWRYKGSTRPAGAATGHRVALAGSTARRQARGAGSGKKSDADASLED